MQTATIVAIEPHDCRPSPDGKSCPYCMQIYLAKSRIKWEAFLKRIQPVSRHDGDNRVMAAIMNQEK